MFTIAVVIVLAAALIAAHTSVNYYVITPGDATPVAQFIEVPAADNHPLTGKILLTDVYVTQLNALNYLQYRFFDSDSEVVSAPELLGPTPNEGQYLAQGYLQMAQAQSFATAAALSRLGYTVTSTNAGALVYGIAAAFAGGLDVAGGAGDHRGERDPRHDRLLPDPRAARVAARPQRGAHGRAVLHQRRGPVRERPGRDEVGDARHAAQGAGRHRLRAAHPSRPPTSAFRPQTQQDWHFPVKVTVHTQDIGGPSAGLAMTLGIIDKLSSGRLTGNRIVAATGTIDQNGNVGDVGGVAEKTVAVERAGATVFFVPSVELKTAESKATPQLHVYAVNNLNQVLRILTRLGGKRAHQACAGPGGAVGSGHGRRTRPHLIVPDRDRRHRAALLRRGPAGLRQRRGALLPAIGRPQPRGARGARGGAADGRWPRPRSGPPTPSWTRPP